MKPLRIAILGCGNMGMAFAKAFLHYNLVARPDLLLLARHADHCQQLSAQHPSLPVAELSPAVAGYGVVLVAVKPQDFSTVAAGLRAVLRPEQVVVSIMAGIPIARLQRELHHPQGAAGHAQRAGSAGHGHHRFLGRAGGRARPAAPGRKPAECHRAVYFSGR